VGSQAETSPGANLPQAAFSPGRASPISGGGEVSATAATSPKSVQAEATAILRCLHEALQHPGFATALVLLLSGKRPGEDDGSPNQHFSIAPTENLR